MLQIFCDGGSRGNPGDAAFGFVIKKDGQILEEASGYIGRATNNFAEYTAITKAFEWLAQNYKGAKLEVFLDSLLAVSQLNGHYKVKNATIRQFIFQIRQLETDFSKVIYKHIPRQQNQHADKLVNLALNRFYGA